jgi:hypothetical protein
VGGLRSRSGGASAIPQQEAAIVKRQEGLQAVAVTLDKRERAWLLEAQTKALDHLIAEAEAAYNHWMAASDKLGVSLAALKAGGGFDAGNCHRAADAHFRLSAKVRGFRY